jgi:hypothetical protein
VVFRHPTGEYQPFEYSSNSNHFVPPYGGPPPGSLPQLAAANGSTHHGFDHAWSQSFPESNPERWAYDHPGHTNPLDTSDHYIGATWSGNPRDTRRLEQNLSNVQNTSRYTWHSSATQADFAGPSPSSAASAHYPEGHYWSTPQSALPAYHGHYSFHPQYTHAPGTGEPAPGFQPASTSTLHGEIPLVTSSTTVKHETLTPVDDDEKRYNPFGFIQQTSFGVAIPAAQSRTPPKSTPALPPDEEDDEEDPWDVELDFADPYSVPLTQSQHDLDSMLVKFNSKNERRARTFTTFLNGPSILATYRPSIAASPLNDEKVARIFCHFISVTGPCISIFERQASPSTTLSGSTPIPAPQKTLWSYTLPSIALHHPALLHAMLALSALHISKLQDTPEDPAIKHYTYAVRRIGKLLGLPRRRHEAATLAANLLVGFYEVMASDHSRWSVHLAGAKVLVTEIDFATMTRTIRGMRSRARQHLAGRPIMSYEEYEEWLQSVGIPESLLDDKDWEIDQDLISKLTGYHIEYDRQYQPNYPPKGHPRDLTAKEIDDYKIKSDLHWWYAKQDVFQSMVSGDVLLMPYRRWIYCPPRGQVGRPDAAYATMDHLVLIMARLTEFGGRDRVRKVKMVKARGGQWRPPAHFYGPNNPPPTPTVLTPDSNPSTQGPTGLHQNGSASRNGLQHGPTAQPSSGPGFYGMMPHSTDPVEMHSAFYKMHANIHDQAFHDPMHDEGSVHSSSSQTLEDDTAAASKEHAEIIKSFKLFFDSLGEDYQPLAVDACNPISTPFGQALQYRTYAIACVWAFYYVGLILIERFHPDMPPAAMVAAGVTAHRTKENAQNVGRICAGLYYSQQQSLQTGNLNPGLGAALMESTFFLFFAAVNYQDAGQRGWTISKLRDIAQKTGWQTSAAVAAACEVSWEKMGEAGRGPVYKTTMDRNNTDLRVRRKNKLGDGSTREEDDDKSTGPGLPTYNRKAIHTNQSTRVHWALGLLSVEKDIEQLNLDKK